MFESTRLVLLVHPRTLPRMRWIRNPTKIVFLSDTSRRSSIHLHDLLAILLFLFPFSSPGLINFTKYWTGHQKSEAIASEQTSGSSCRQVFDSTARVVDRRCYTLARSKPGFGFGLSVLATAETPTARCPLYLSWCS